MKTKIIAIIGIVAVIVVAVWLNQRRVEKAKVSALSDSWAVWEEYIAAAKEHNLAKITELSYQLSEACKDPKQKDECNNRMDTAYYFGSQIKKEDVAIFGMDKKQVILTSPYVENDNGDIPSITRIIIYFVRDAGKLKFLSMNPFEGAMTFRGGQATSTISAKLWDMVKDSDSDALPDGTENCTDAESGANCVKTNPNKKDTNGNGWWDSTERLFYKTDGSNKPQE